MLHYTACLALLALAVTASPVWKNCNQPLYQYEDAVEHIDIVTFKEGTPDQHRNTIGLDFQVVELDNGYFSNTTADVLEKVRSDCNVDSVETDTLGYYRGQDLSESTSEGLSRRAEQLQASWPLYYLSANQKLPLDRALTDHEKTYEVRDTSLAHRRCKYS